MIYTIHSRLSESQIVDTAHLANSELMLARADHLVAIPESVAKWAVIAPPVWLVWHGLWGALLAYGLYTIVMLSLIGTALMPIALFIGGLPVFYLLLEGHELRRHQLERRGYELLAVVDGQDENHAITSYLTQAGERVKSTQAVAMPQTHKPQNRPALTPSVKPAFGMFAEDSV